MYRSKINVDQLKEGKEHISYKEQQNAVNQLTIEDNYKNTEKHYIVVGETCARALRKKH